MNIYAIKGHRVKCNTLDAGYEYDQQRAKEHLEVGKEYTVDYTEVDNWTTRVFLEEFPEISFNSVFFEDVAEQPREDDRKHADYRHYNGN